MTLFCRMVNGKQRIMCLKWEVGLFMARRICCCGRKRKRTSDSEWHLITMVAIAYSFGYILVSKTSLIDVLSLNIVLIICLFDALNNI